MPLAGAVRQQQRLDAPKSADLSELMILNFKTFDPLQPPLRLVRRTTA